AGRGTAVRMWFPAAPSPRAGATAPARPAASRLLLVEDDAASRQALCMLLEDEGFAVEARATAEQALAALLSCPLDALVVDFQLPGMEGVMRASAARERGGALPVVIMSGFDRSTPKLAAFLRTPRTELVGKPIDVHVLVDTLTRLVAPAEVDTIAH